LIHVKVAIFDKTEFTIRFPGTSLINALHIVLSNSHNKVEYFEDDNLDISFAPEKWQNLILKKDKTRRFISRRYLEMAIFLLKGQKLILIIEMNY